MAEPKPDGAYRDKEAARRRDAVVRRLLATPPKPHKAQPATKRPRRERAEIVCPTAHIMEELAGLAKGSVDGRACLREFLDTKPIIAALKVDARAAVRAGHTVYYDEPSQALMDALEAVRIAAKHR